VSLQGKVKSIEDRTRQIGTTSEGNAS